MFKQRPDLPLLPPASKLWRYMDLTKLLGILVTKKLRFTSLTAFEDKYEGYSPLLSGDDFINKGKADDPSWTPSPTTEAMATNLGGMLRESRLQIRNACFVNCWHHSDHESAAMWKLYLSTSEGVAVQSTVQRLIDSLASAKQDIHIGEAKYVDLNNFPKRPVDFPEGVLLKRKSFEHEKEVRAIHLDPNLMNSSIKPPNGIDIPVDPPKLIEAIYLAPTCPSWVKPIIEAEMDHYGLKDRVIQSNMNTDPVW